MKKVAHLTPPAIAGAQRPSDPFIDIIDQLHDLSDDMHLTELALIGVAEAEGGAEELGTVRATHVRNMRKLADLTEQIDAARKTVQP